MPNTFPSNATEKEVLDFFATADTDKDGLLTKEEITNAFSANGQTLSTSELDSAFTKSDSNVDGKLSIDELKKYLL